MTREEKTVQPLEPRAIAREVGQTSPVAVLALALASGLGYLAWKLWTKRREDKDLQDGTAGSRPEASANPSKSKNKGSSFTFDRQPKASTSGRSAVPASNSHGGAGTSQSRRDAKPKSQKQLRKEAKQAKKAAREQAARDAESSQLAATISKRAREAGLGQQQQQPEPEKHYHVDYEAVTKGYDKIVEWQQTGKKKY